jgi:CheY-like chemotaxis protein
MALAAKVMIVDDDVETRQLLAEELRDLGHASVHAADGVQALSLVRHERPDLILLDLQLPAVDRSGVSGGDGFCVLERLGNIAEIASVPVIVFSGVRSPGVQERALLLGAREFVHKSFNGHDLFEAIARVLAADPSPRQLPSRRFAVSSNV